MSIEKTSERREKIHFLIEEREGATVQELCDTFKVSEATIRRDLRDLEQRGLLSRVREGAIHVNLPIHGSRTPSGILEVHERIGRAAVQRLNEGDIVFLGPGSITLAAVRQMHLCQGLTVVVSNTQQAIFLRGQGKHYIWILCGRLDGGTGDIYGPFAEQMLERFRADVGLIGCDAVNPEVGFVIKAAHTANLLRAVAKHSQRMVVLADHTQFSPTATGIVFPFEEADLLITDREVDEELSREILNAGLQVKRV